MEVSLRLPSVIKLVFMRKNFKERMETCEGHVHCCSVPALDFSSVSHLLIAINDMFVVLTICFYQCSPGNRCEWNHGPFVLCRTVQKMVDCPSSHASIGSDGCRRDHHDSWCVCLAYPLQRSFSQARMQFTHYTIETKNYSQSWLRCILGRSRSCHMSSSKSSQILLSTMTAL